MPSKDPINEKANAWMVHEGLVSSDPEKRRGTSPGARGQHGSRIESRGLSGQVLRLAKRLGKDPDELAASIPSDTLRRTKYPVLEHVDDKGRRTFKHDPQIEEGRIALAK